MPRQTSPTSSLSKVRKASVRPLRVLLVDHEPQVKRLLAKVATREPIKLLQAQGVAQARQCLAQNKIDLVLIEPNLPDGSGLKLAEEQCRRQEALQAIVISGQPNLEEAIKAIRVGASDFLTKPLDLEDLSERIKMAIARHRDGQRSRRRIRRLRRICQKLSQAHEEVTQQVDVLCNDLVTAYQELSIQMKQVIHASEFTAQVKGELDLENLICKTLEFLLGKAGPTNAALFVPASMGEFALGGYINYDISSSSLEVLLQHLSEVLAPTLADCQEPVHITDNHALGQWLGDDSPFLQDYHLLGLACRHEDETLAIVAMFREGSEPFEADLVETGAAIAPLLANYLAKLIRIHHRHLPDVDSDDDGFTSIT